MTPHRGEVMLMHYQLKALYGMWGVSI